MEKEAYKFCQYNIIIRKQFYISPRTLTFVVSFPATTCYDEDDGIVIDVSKAGVRNGNSTYS